MENKKCGNCKEFRSIDNFYICRTRSKDGYRNTCKPCEQIYKKAYYQRHPDRFKKAYKEFIERNPNYQKEYMEKKKGIKKESI